MIDRRGRRRVLVVAYYFPPMGLSGVQRVAKFVRYLPEHGWDPVVLTVHPGGYFAFDHGLLREVEEAGVEVVRTSSWDPTRLFGSAQRVALPGEQRRRWLALLSQMVFVPDNKVGWLVPALRRGRQLLRTHAFDAVLSSAPPYTGHLIGAALSRLGGLPLLLDYRDDWVGNPRHTYPTLLHRKLHESMERWVMERAQAVTTINDYIAQSLAERHPAAASRLQVVPQGYDAADFEDAAEMGASDDRFRLVYTGVFYHAQRPDTFLQGLGRLLHRRPELRDRIAASFVGLLPTDAVAEVERLELRDVVRHEGYVEHDAVVSHLRRADVLWMTVGRQPGEEQISTGKLFEYMGSRKPVLGLVPPGAAADTLRAYGAGLVVDPDDVGAAAEAIEQLFDAWSEQRLPTPDASFVLRHERKALAGELGGILDCISAALPAR